jgi:hypothetical protein
MHDKIVREVELMTEAVLLIIVLVALKEVIKYIKK